MVQPDLFPKNQTMLGEEIPDSVMNDLRILSGDMPDDRSSLPSPLAKSAQDRFLDQRSKKEQKVQYEIKAPTLLVLDVATAEGQAKYQSVVGEIIPKVMAEPNKWRWSEKSMEPLIDPNSPAGFRLIVVIKYWEQVESVIPGDHGFTVVKPS